MVTCTECNKTFRKESGLAWHLERTHGRAQQPAVFHQRSEQQVSEKQQVSLLEDRLEWLEYITGVRKPVPASVVSEPASDGLSEPASRGIIVVRETTLPEQLNGLTEEVTKLSDTVSKLSEEVELAQVSNLAEQDRALEDLKEKFELELNSLAAVVNNHRATFNHDLAVLESRIDKVQKTVSNLHVCPDCGRSLHLHRLDASSWHLECVHCGYCSVNYKAPKWKETRGELFASKQGA